ncbi:response regulator [Pseudothauera nasutitermitis]|uniref:response regulator n=1 Tax=Pseudothauera nasutitermitis TaxID=2565930 RepID=UPI001B3B2B95|nr:response regulator transcription factor [Pseudothauera nasutitermitis]
MLIADDHALVRGGLRALIGALDSFEVVGEAADGDEVVVRAVELDPQIILMDLSMPRAGGMQAIARVHAVRPACAILVLSMHASDYYVGEALQAGAVGYLVKDSAPEELESALHAVAAGGHYLSPRLASQRARAGADLLTPRQRQILRLIAEGLGTREIAERLEISVKTVETHRAQIMQRLDIHDVAGLTRHAIRIGLISPEE